MEAGATGGHEPRARAAGPSGEGGICLSMRVVEFADGMCGCV